MINIVTRDSPVDLKEYLESSPSLSIRSSLKYYFANKAEMKMYNTVNAPKFAIAESECNTVINKIWRDLQDLIILNILNNLKALKTDNPDVSPGINNSTILSTTIRLSKMLNPSATYPDIPSPMSLKIISKEKSIVKSIFALSLASVNHYG